MTTETQTFSPPHLHTEWVMVPKEPTQEMITAGVHHDNMGDMAGRYRAMLSAAPPPPVTTREADAPNLNTTQDERDEWLKYDIGHEVRRLIEDVNALNAFVQTNDSAVSSAIERCAKVAETLIKGTCRTIDAHMAADEIATAIRSLLTARKSGGG
jgi:hypothetical protein